MPNPPPDNVVPFGRKRAGSSPRWKPPRWLTDLLIKTTVGWIILANVLVWLAMVVAGGGRGIINQFSGELLARAGMLIPALVPHQPWRVLTASFLHSGLMHLALNMVFLGWIGPRLETAFGKARFLALYFASALGGGLLSWGWNSLPWLGDRPSVGASGAIMGVLGGMVALTWRAAGRNHPLTRMWLLNSVWIFVGGLVLSLLGSVPTDNACHLGGWLVGLGVASVFAGRPPWPRVADRLVIGLAAALSGGIFVAQLGWGWEGEEKGVAALLAAARAAVERQDWPTADQKLAQLERAQSDVVEYRVLRAQVLLKEGKKGEAKEEVDNAAHIGTHDPDLAVKIVELLQAASSPSPPAGSPSPPEAPSPTGS